MPRSVATKTKAAAGRTTMAEFAAAIVEDYRARGVTRSMVWMVLRVMRIVEEKAGVLLARELEQPDIISRWDKANPYRNAQSSQSTTKTFYGILRRGRVLGLLHTIPPIPVVPKVPKGTRDKPPSEADYLRLMEHLKKGAVAWEGRRLYALASVVALAGIGLAQALRLRVADVDLAGSKIWLSGGAKLRRMRESAPISVRMDPELRKILAGWIRHTKCEWAFPGARRVSPWNTEGHSNPLKVLKAAAREAGTKRVTFASLLRYHAEKAVKIIPDPRSAARRPESATSPDPGPIPSVRIGEPEDVVFVRDKPKQPLSGVQYQAISALLQAWPHGLSLKAMGQQFGGKTSWRTTLRRLKESDPDWDSAIRFPAKGFPGKDANLYRIMPY